MDYTERTLEEEAALIPGRVERFATMLDRNRSGWYWEINPDELDIACNCDCAVGQLYGPYSEKGDEIFGSPEGGVEYGVYASPDLYSYDDQTQYYKLLTDAWLEEISLRRNADLLAEKHDDEMLAA